jgi:lipopolysaccharide/colanic/teichoic acid biosynthesis glycosyltransferase
MLDSKNPAILLNGRWDVRGLKPDLHNVTDFKEWVRLDLHYIDNWSIWLDLKILLLTIPAVFSGAGAK